MVAHPGLWEKYAKPKLHMIVVNSNSVGMIAGVAVLSDGNRIVSVGGDDKTIHLWNTGRVLKRIFLHSFLDNSSDPTAVLENMLLAGDGIEPFLPLLGWLESDNSLVLPESVLSMMVWMASARHPCCCFYFSLLYMYIHLCSCSHLHV